MKQAKVVMQRPSSVVKRITAWLLLMVCFFAVIFLFWQQEYRYTIPTPVPASYKPVLPGDSIDLPASLKRGNAYFLHFYNPDCPCSRFNAKHVQSLIRSYGDSVYFKIVVTDPSLIKKAKAELGQDLEFIADPNETIATACGVYSTPQAALITEDGKLFYRGNYNRSRYCTQRATNFAELSLIAMIHHQPPPLFGLLATQSYGCELHDDASEFELF